MRNKEIKAVLLFAAAIVLAQLSWADRAIDARLSRVRYEMITEGNYDEALEVLTAMEEHNPEDMDISVTRAMAYYGRMGYEKAADMIREIQSKNPQGDLRKMIDHVSIKINENSSALKKIEMSLSNEERAAGHILVLNNLMKERLIYPLMVSGHLNWLKANIPDMPGLFRVSGDINYSAMMYIAAVEDYKTAIEKDGSDPELYRMVADSYVAVGDFSNAGKYYSNAIDMYQDSRTSEDRKIISHLRGIKRSLPQRYDDVWKLVSKNRYEEAETILRRRISLNPLDYVALTQLGDIYWRKGNRRTSSRIFRRVKRMAPEYPVIHFFLGRERFFANDHKAAGKNFDEFRDRMDSLPAFDDDARDFYVGALNYMAYLYSTQRRYDIMMEKYEKALKLDPESQDTHFNMAVCYYNFERRPSAAYRHLRKVIDIDENSNLARRAQFFIDFMRRNPDARFIRDFSFIYEY